jgi:hypothetical protein
LAQRFVRHVEAYSYPNELTDWSRQDYRDTFFMRNAVRQSLLQIAPDIAVPTDFHFDVTPEPTDFVTVKTNLDFAALNQHLQRTTGNQVNYSAGDFLLNILEARASMYFAARYTSEVATNPIYSAIIMTRFAELINAREHSDKAIEDFQRMVLANTHAIRGVINSGEQTMANLLPLLRRATNFRSWLHDKEPSADLIHAYYNDVTKETWVSKLPSKGIRWIIPVGVAVLGLASPEAAISSFLAG